jgi:putative salt-induced outer membrane protein
MRPSLILMLIVLCPVLAGAQTPPAPAAPPPRWERKAEMSLVSTGGNTDTQTLGLGASMVFRPGAWTTEARTAFVQSETDDIETAQSFVADLRQARTVSPRIELFGRYGYLADRFAGIDDRSTIDGGVGFKALLGPVHTLRLDAGLGYSHENRLVGEDLSFPLANFGAGYKWQISKTADLTDAAIFTAPLDGSDPCSQEPCDRTSWRFGNTFALTAVLTQVLSLKLAHDMKVNNSPVAGFEKTDRITSVALVAKF